MNDQIDVDKHALIDEQASDWFTLIQLGQPSEHDKIAFENWRNHCPEHRMAYETMTNIWQTMALLPEDTFSPTLDLSEHASSPELPMAQVPGDNGVHAIDIARKTKKMPFASFHYYAAAAVFFVAFVIGFSSILLSQSNSGQIYATDIAEIRNVTLEDGSQLFLSAHSEITVFMTAKQRRVVLTQGEIYFDIEPQRDKDNNRIPFIVLVDDVAIDVIGTEFEVEKQQYNTNISVTEGVVNIQIENNKDAVSLVAGKRVAFIGPQRRMEAPTNIDISSVATWRTGRLTYLDATLADVISDAQRFHSGSITLSDSALSSLRLTTSFGIDEIPDLAKILEEILPVKVFFGEHGHIVITPRYQS